MRENILAIRTSVKIVYARRGMDEMMVWAQMEIKFC